MLPDEVLKRVLKWVFHNGWKWKTSQNEDLHSSHYSFQPTVFEKSLDDGAKHFLMLREVSLRFRELIAESYFRLWHWQVDNTQRWYEWTRMTQGHLELAVFDLENVKGLLSLRMEDLEDEIERKRWHAAHGLS